jgi:hypothetical protein
MYRILALFLLITLSVSCKKVIERKKEQAVIDAITNGTWLVELYSENGLVRTGDFKGYEFKFNENETLNALRAGSTIPGTWKADVAQYSITTNFPSATDPLKKLNGVWKLTDSYLDYVEAESTTSGVEKKLHLRKK